jgi:hypothetical protein
MTLQGYARFRATFRHLSRAATMLAFGLGGAGCSGGDEEPRGGSVEGPLYVGATVVFTADDFSQGSAYLFTTRSLDAGTPVDLARAVELPEDAWVFGDADPYFWSGTRRT